MADLIKREELYKLVWSKPITKIAIDYKVSDSAIIKICKKMEIPRPGLGYWTKVECGKQVKVTPLPKLTKKGVEHYYLWRQGYSEGRSDQSGSLHPLIKQEATPGLSITVAKSLDDPHPTTAINIKRFNNAKPDNRGILRPNAHKHFDLQITRGTQERALLIMDALLKAFEARGWVFEIRSEPKLSMSVRLLDEDIRFSLEESVGAVEHVLTDKEKRARARGDWVYPPRYDYVPSGRLKLKIHTFYSYHGRASWGDAKIQRVENSLNRFCSGLVQHAEASKAKRIQDEKDRIKQALVISNITALKFGLPVI
ncbi:MAG: hypothetical protein H6985_05100 [Pseudomonadales bacterium]|nr:hypothetical protein [Pseudomonadales bacterium]